MKKTTVCFLIKGDDICLAMKRRGFGIGKWNGVGGKVEKTESVTAAAIRELNEEIGVIAAEADLESMGDIKFYFNNRPDWNQHMRVFIIKKWSGEPGESDEMCPAW